MPAPRATRAALGRASNALQQQVTVRTNLSSAGDSRAQRGSVSLSAAHVLRRRRARTVQRHRGESTRAELSRIRIPVAALPPLIGMMF